jgi:hypothetical protein
MILVIEGPNRCGKSTQIANLKNYYESKGMRVHVIHYEHIHLDPTRTYTPEAMKDMATVRYDDMLKLANEFAKDPMSVIIFDRAHLGEHVYGPKYRDYSGEYVFELEKKYPESEGYEIISEAYLRDSEGKIVRDPETGEARRIDFVIVKDGQVVDSIEVTSETADKTGQTAKEERIREAGGNYIRTYDGSLAKYPNDLHTTIERRK